MSTTKKFADKDRELGKLRKETIELKDLYKYLEEEHEEKKKTLESTQMRLLTSENARVHAGEDAKRQHGEFASLDLKHVELQTSHTELSSKFEFTHKKVISLKQTNSVYK